MPTDGRILRRFLYIAIACVMATAMARHLPAHVKGAGGEDGETEPTRSERPPGDAPPDAPRAAKVDPSDADADPDMEARFGTSAVDVPGTATGVIFINGRYIDAPYRVVRRGLAIYVNDIRVERLQWPSRYYQRDDPPLPPGIDRDSQLADIKDWMHLKARYHYSHFGPSDAVQRTVDAYRAMPCIRRVELLMPDGISRFGTNMKIELWSGEVYEVAVELIDLRPTPEHVVERTLERYMEYWQGLARTRGLLYHTRGLQLIYPNHSATWFALPEIVAILRTDQPPEQKAAALHPFFAGQFSDPEQLRLSLKPLLTDFEGTPQLDARLENIRKEREARQK